MGKGWATFRLTKVTSFLLVTKRAKDEWSFIYRNLLLSCSFNENDKSRQLKAFDKKKCYK